MDNPRETGNIGHTRHTGRRQKQKNNTPLYTNKHKQRKQDMSPPTND
jgi:hypothetical protein